MGERSSVPSSGPTGGEWTPSSDVCRATRVRASARTLLPLAKPTARNWLQGAPAPARESGGAPPGLNTTSAPRPAVTSSTASATALGPVHPPRRRPPPPQSALPGPRRSQMTRAPRRVGQLRTAASRAAGGAPARPPSRPPRPRRGAPVRSMRFGTRCGSRPPRRRTSHRAPGRSPATTVTSANPPRPSTKAVTP